jgi:hypothetical protein
MNTQLARTRTIRLMNALMITLFLITGLIAPVYAQSSAPVQGKEVHLFMQDGWSGSGRQMSADDFVLVCPSKEVLDPNHPCSSANAAAQVEATRFNDFVLVCPTKEVLDPNHPCYDRNAQIKRSIAADFVLVCPTEEVLDPTHPCSKQKAGAKFEVPGDFVLTCPVKDVLEQHPCAARSKSAGTLAVQQSLFLPKRSRWSPLHQHRAKPTPISVALSLPSVPLPAI